MPDVAKLANSGNIIYNGSRVSHVTPLGTASIIHPEFNIGPDASGIAAKYDERFDDPRYYSGDTPA